MRPFPFFYEIATLPCCGNISVPPVLLWQCQCALLFYESVPPALLRQCKCGPFPFFYEIAPPVPPRNVSAPLPLLWQYRCAPPTAVAMLMCPPHRCGNVNIPHCFMKVRPLPCCGNISVPFALLFYESAPPALLWLC